LVVDGQVEKTPRPVNTASFIPKGKLLHSDSGSRVSALFVVIVGDFICDTELKIQNRCVWIEFWL
jgi:hypothetical protein